HGTHVAGTIGAVANTDGVVGVAWEVQLMPLRFLGPAGTGDTSDAISAIYYYRDQGLAHPGLNFVATNNSWGGGDFSQLLADAIEDSGDHGHLFVAAAGNDATDNDVTPHYPSNLNLTSTYMGVSFDPVISVAAIDSDGNLSSFSNWGATSVDIGAPGSDIASTFSGTEYFGSYSYVYLGGTSMATPHVTGAIALIASENPGAMPWDIRDAILERAVPLPSLDGITTTGARLNVANVIDLSAPSVTVTLDAAILTIANPTTTVTFAFSEEVQNFGYDDITITNGAGDLTGLTSSDNITFTATFQAATLNGTTATIIVGTGYQDLDSEIGLGGTSDPFAVDLVAPTATITAIDASTGTSGVDISGTVSAAPAIGEFVFVLRDGTPIAVANVSGTNWNYTDTETLADGLYAYTALVADLVGNGGLESDVAQYYSGAFDFDLTVGTPETGDYGRAFNGTADADGKITTRFTSTGADLLLSVTGFDIDFVNEVQVLLNGSPLGFLAITGDLATGPTKLPIDAADQIAGENVIQFVNVNPTYAWGITDVLVAPPPSWDFELVPGTTVTTKYGNQFDGKTDPDGVITAGFTGTSGDLILTLDGFDVDFANEVTVALNGTPLGNLAVTANNATGPSEFMIPVEDQLVGENLITFTQNLNPTYAWGITNLLIEAAPWWDLLLETGTTDTMSYGKAFNGTNDADGLITARFDSIGSDLHLSVTTYDVDFTDEVQVKVNGTSLGFFGLTANNGTGTFGVDIPAGLQVEGENAITFQNKNAAYVWGLTDVLLETDPAFTLTPGSTETGSYGNKFNGQTDADGVITATFIGTAGDLELTLQGFDVDFTDEVRVDLNGQPLGFLALTANNMEGPSSFAIPVADQLAGENVLTFVQTRDVNYIWGLTDVALNPIA
ncbi:MAG: S8 family serine peptidase, partial [Novosphingobium sp.]|nr:S8 family serine peptidase [Novosphingobium sp.]